MKHILITNLAGIGDVLLSIPALRALRNLYPQAEISILVPPKIKEIVERLSYIDRVFTFEMGYGGGVPIRGLYHNFGVLMALRKKHYDLSINMRTIVSKKSAGKLKFLLNIINPGKTVGRDTEGRGSFFDVRLPETDIGQKHEMEYDIDTVKLLGAEVNDKRIEINIDSKDTGTVNGMLKNRGIVNDVILVGIHPGGMPSRRWGLENFAQVVNELSQKENCRFVITGGKDEVSLAKKLQDACSGNIINLAGELNTYELCALIKRCSLYISNDTGPMHIAALINTPLIAIFGPGDITRFDPRRISDRAVVLRKETHCAPCNNAECDLMKCLQSITPEDVYAVVIRLLHERTGQMMSGVHT